MQIQIQTYYKIYEKQNFLIEVIILFLNQDIYNLNHARFVLQKYLYLVSNECTMTF